jgi:PilZ domain
MIDERRRFERVSLPQSAKVYLTDTQKRRLGPVLMIGRGGLLFKSDVPFETGSHVDLLLVDDTEGIRRELNGTVRYSRADGVGIEFDALEPDAAVEVGVIIGKYYSAETN